MPRDLASLQHSALHAGGAAYREMQRLAGAGRLDDQALRELSRSAGIPGARLTSLASFYDEFRLRRTGKHVLRVCRGIACFACGGDALLRGLEAVLGVTEGETTANGAVTLTSAACLGCCGQGPALEVDGVVRRAAEARQVDAFAAALAGGQAAPPPPVLENHVATQASFGAPTIVLRNFGRNVRDLAQARRHGIYDTLARVRRAMTGTETVRALEISKLCERAGAGLSVGMKCRRVRDQPARIRRVGINAGAAAPGSIVEKELLERDPHSVLEGALLAAHAAGARHVHLFAGGAQGRAIENMTRAAAGARKVLPRGAPEIEIIRGAGAYICSEETALLRAIEGQLPLVSAASPHDRKTQLFGDPTLVLDVETLHALPWILRHGPRAFAAIGRGASRGTRAVTLSAHFACPGLHEIPLGVTLRQVVELGGGVAHGQELLAVQVGGPLGGVFPPTLLDTPLTEEDISACGGALGHAGIVLYPKGTRLLDVARHCLEFCALESCGKCVPCRVGSFRSVEMIEQLLHGAPSENLLPPLREIAETMRHASLCHLGARAPRALETILRYFPQAAE